MCMNQNEGEGYIHLQEVIAQHLGFLSPVQRDTNMEPEVKDWQQLEKQDETISWSYHEVQIIQWKDVWEYEKSFYLHLNEMPKPCVQVSASQNASQWHIVMHFS